MKHEHHFIRVAITLAALTAFGSAADEPAPAPAAPRVKTQIQIQGGGQLQIQGGAQFKLQFGNGVIQAQAVAGDLADATVAKPQAVQPPVIFFPGIPSILLPNPAAQGDVKPGFLGVTLDTAVDAQADDANAKEKAGEKKNAGVGILTVIEDSPAAKAGLKEGDRVLAIEGKETKNSTQLRESIRAMRPEKAVKLTVLREGKEIEIKAKLGAAPDPAPAVQFAAQNLPESVPGIVFFNRGVRIGSRPATGSAGGNSKGASSDKDTVLLRDGNRFSGKIQGIDPARGLILKREGLPDVELLEEGIGSLTFADREKTEATPSKVHLQLRDGSWFNADALTMEQGKILLTLPGALHLQVPKEHALSATVSDGQAPQIYDGPTGLSGWSTLRPGSAFWEYKDGYLRCLSNGPIGRNFERMPDPLDLSFDVAFPRQLQHFGITLFAAGVNQSGAGTLTVQFSPNRIYAHHFDGRRSNQYNVETPVPADPKDADAAVSRYRLLVDRVKGRALIYIDGVKRADWKLSKVNPEDIGKCGAFFTFTPNIFTSEATFQFGRMRLLPWDGKEPANGAEPAAVKTDQILTGDGSAKDGPIDRITDREVLLASEGGSVRRDKTLYVRFAAPPGSQQLPAAAAVLRLKNGSEFAATQLRGDGGAMTLTTRFGLQVALPLSTLGEIEFLTKPGQPQPSADSLDVLTFTDGTQLKGRVLPPVGGENLRWKIAASKNPLEFPATRIAGVLFAQVKGQAETPALKGSGTVRLRTGDWFQGDIISLDAKRLLFRTDLAPEMDIPLTSLHSLYLGSEVIASLADGATGPDSWTGGWNPNRANVSRQQFAAISKAEQPWMYHDGSYAPAGASRTGGAILARKWPAYSGAYAVSIEIANPSRSASFNVQLYNSKDERTFTIYAFGGRMNVYFNPGASARNNRLGGAGKRFQVDERTETSGGNFRMTAVMDRPTKTFRLFVSGKEIGKIPFKEDDAKDALDVGAMSLTPMSSGLANSKQSRIAGIWLAPWGGSPASPGSPAGKEEAPAPGTEPKKDAAPVPTIYLANGDEFAGAIEKLTADALTVNSDAGPLDLPCTRVAWIRFPGPEVTPADHFPRLRFHDRGLLSVKDLHIGDDRVKCTTLQGQALEFPLNLVKEVVYRPLDD
jgi:hypothetical protein